MNTEQEIDLAERIGLVIRWLREYKRQTQAELAGKVGLPRSQLSMMEWGKANKRINLKTLRGLARELGLPNLSTLIAWAEQDLKPEIIRQKLDQLKNDPSAF